MPPIPTEPRDVSLNLLSFLFEVVFEIKDNPGHWYVLIGWRDLVILRPSSLIRHDQFYLEHIEDFVLYSDLALEVQEIQSRLLKFDFLFQ